MMKRYLLSLPPLWGTRDKNLYMTMRRIPLHLYIVLHIKKAVFWLKIKTNTGSALFVVFARREKLSHRCQLAAELKRAKETVLRGAVSHHCTAPNHWPYKLIYGKFLGWLQLCGTRRAQFSDLQLFSPMGARSPWSEAFQRTPPHARSKCRQVQSADIAFYWESVSLHTAGPA
jgi:hypothetical protein